MKKHLLIFGILTICAITDHADVIRGEKGDWTTHWIGISVDNMDRLKGANLDVAEAIKAAEDGNVTKFYSFWGCESNTAPAQVKAWFEEWRLFSKNYIYSIMEEAEISIGGESVSNQYAAISVAPVALRAGSEDLLTNGLQFKVNVIFIRKDAGAWKLLPNVFDLQIVKALQSKGSAVQYRPGQSYSKEALAKDKLKFHSEILESMKKNDATPEQITSQKEIFQADESGATLNSWAAWTNYYSAIVLNPPITFEKRDLNTYNFHDLIPAFQSYLRALWIGDAKTLFEYSDTTGQRSLRQMGVNTSVKADTYDITNGWTHVTVLMTATTKIDDQYYGLVFWRGQNENNPKNGSIIFQSTIFVRINENYLRTKSLDESSFYNVLFAAHAGIGIGKYSAYSKQLRQSQFPPSFYDLP